MKEYVYFEAYLDDMKTVSLYMHEDSYKGISNSFYLQDDDHNIIDLKIKKTNIKGKYHCYQCTLEEDIVFGRHYLAYNEHGRYTELLMKEVVKKDAFDQMFYYDGELGTFYSKDKTTFKVWAPTAYEVWVETNKNGKHIYPMQRQDKGVYEVTIEEDLLGASYVYYVHVNGKINKTIDPYGKASTPNSLYSVVVDVDSIKVKEAPVKIKHNTDAIIYEANISDMTREGTIPAFLESNMFTHIKNLGITHLQLMPVLDYKSVDDLDLSRYYNWGYDAHQWMAFENSLSGNPLDPMAVINDMSSLITKMHENGMYVSLDVIFNHVYEFEDHALQKTVPYYYFQYNHRKGLSGATGCGNDIDSTRKMCRKIIVDSCIYLAKTFKIDGLRFDLMGILDIDTMNMVRDEVHKIDPSFIVYGEGWNMNSYLKEVHRACISNNSKMDNIAHFSDRFRNTLKGLDNTDDKGYLLGDTNKIYSAMNCLGASCQNIGLDAQYDSPQKVLNYVECHDNMTAFDKLEKIFKEDNIKTRYINVLNAVVLMSQGIPFIHCGQEFARTKNGKHNTYNDNSGVNKIDKGRMALGADCITYVKEWIQIRKKYPCLHLATQKEIHNQVTYDTVDAKVLVYNVHDDKDDLKIYINPTNDNVKINVPENYQMIYYNALFKSPEYPTTLNIHGQCIVVFEKIKQTVA